MAYYQRAPSPSPYANAPRAPSPLPYGPPSPVPPTHPLQPAPNSGPGGQIQPGTITYTTSTSPDGKTTYHPFRWVTTISLIVSAMMECLSPRGRAILGLYQSGYYLYFCRMRCSYSRPFHRSYQTANGVVSGVQWVPAEATSVMPTGAQPANAVCRSTLCPVISDNGANQLIRTSCHPGVEGIEMTRH
jgi:hypothetical protein